MDGKFAAKSKIRKFTQFPSVIQSYNLFRTIINDSNTVFVVKCKPKV